MSQKDVMYLVDQELDHVINWGTRDEMIEQLDSSYGNLFVVSFENLSTAMKVQVGGGSA